MAREELQAILKQDNATDGCMSSQYYKQDVTIMERHLVPNPSAQQQEETPPWSAQRIFTIGKDYSRYVRCPPFTGTWYCGHSSP